MLYEELGAEPRFGAFDACSTMLESSYDRSRLNYLREVARSFPMGFGLEDAVRTNCLAAGQLRSFFREAGVCSDIAMAMIVLRCVRERDEKTCHFSNAIRDYYSSVIDSEWRYLEGDALPPGVIIDRYGQRVAAEFREVVQFLDYLAVHVDHGPYDPKRTQEIEMQVVEGYLFAGPIKFSDVDWPSAIWVTPDRIRQELKTRTGRTFRALSQLGWVYGAGAPQLARLEFSRTDTGVRVILPEHYELIFGNFDGSYRLVELKQLMHSDR